VGLSRHSLLVAAVLAVAFLVLPTGALGEPNDSPAGASGPILSGGLYQGTIDTENDTDWWVFYTGTSTQLDVALTGLGADDCFGPEMHLKDASGRLVAESGYPAERFEVEHILYTVGTGTFYVEVFPYHLAPCIGSEADYQLSINSTPSLLASPPYIPPPPAPAPTPIPPAAKPDRSAIRAAAECERARTQVSSLRKKLRHAKGVNYRAIVRAELRRARAAVLHKC
jgi:hypothetical protein